MSSFGSTEYRSFQYPIAGSLQYMRQWTFETGASSLEARTHRYGRDSEMPPLSPKSRLVHIALEEPLASPTTVLNRAPTHQDDESRCTDRSSNQFEYGRLSSPDPRLFSVFAAPVSQHQRQKLTTNKIDDKPLNPTGDLPRKSYSSTLSNCYSCNSVGLDAASHPPNDESSHWYIDVHDGVKRKVAYVFCWKCADLFMRQLQRAPHAGCGHLPMLSLPSCEEECQLMFCGKCRVDMGRVVGGAERLGDGYV